MTTQHSHNFDLQHAFQGLSMHDSALDEGFRTAVREAKKRAIIMPPADPISPVGYDEYHAIVSRYFAMEFDSLAQDGTFWARWGTEKNITDAIFDGIEQDASDSGNPVPSRAVIDEAKRIARGLDQSLLEDCDVYSLEEGKIAIEVFGLPGHGFLLICEPDGSALCIVTYRGVSRRARYERSSHLPDGFLTEGLADARRPY